MKILLTVDGSACSRHAVLEAKRLLPLSQAEVFVLGVTPFAPIMMDPLGDVGLLQTHSPQGNLRQLDEAEAILREAGVGVTRLERDGDPTAQILAVARELQVDMIVLGSHGHSALGSLVMGSVSESVLHHWAGAVLIIRPGDH